MLTFEPKTRDEALQTVATLTEILDMTRRQIIDARNDRVRAVAVARFEELNGPRVRIIEAWGLQAFAAELAGR